MEERSDHELVSAMNRGDVDAFDAIYRRHQGWVHRIAFRFCGSEDDARDATQDVFVYFLGKFPGFKLHGRMTTFLYPVARNAALTIGRKRRRFRLGGLFPAESIVLHPSLPAVERDEDLRALERAIGRLPLEQRELVLMRHVDGMGMQEIADAMRIPLGTVKSRLHRAIESLQGDADFRRSRGLDEK